MDRQRRAVKIQRRRSRAEVKQLVAEFETSGLSRTVFCRQTGLSLSTLARHQRGREQPAKEAAEGKRWLAVEVSGSASAARRERGSGLTVVLPGGWRIEVGRDFDVATFQRLLAVVERG